MPLPRALRTLTPNRLRDDPRLRALALGAGLIPPRTMHSAGEAAELIALARDARRVVELGVYEGSSAHVLVAAMGAGAELHLIDPFIGSTDWSLRAGARAHPAATRRALARATPAGGPSVHWQIARSQEAGRDWSGGPVDVVFIDGDHSYAGCREDFEVWAPHVAVDGAIAFHDARLGHPAGSGVEGPTRVVDELVRGSAGWRVVTEIDSLVVARRAAPSPDGT